MKDNEFPRTMPLFLTGAVLTLLGCLAFAAPSVAGTWVIGVIGVVLLIAGIIQLLTGWWAERWSQRISPIIIGLVSTVSGIGLLTEPWIGSQMVIWVMSIFFVAGGVWKMVTAFSYRPAKGWLLLFFSGVIAVGLGYWMFTRTGEEALEIIGILAGIDFLLTGISILAIAITVRQLMAVVQDVSEHSSQDQKSDNPLLD
ncbi:DUF308 domain-containing protein [bacterium]|nr:DUF308 domain-containing protein [bacterium]MDA7893659.1 DUF308 domain-containing protein [bacterium]MDB4416460.1 DUF308 domain-containing protein [bacterium]MDB4423092.1 DUF308 domain-containing protein [Rhodopirellula sp.]